MASAVGEQVQVYATPSEDEPTVVLDNPNENGAPLVFLVEQDQGDWLQVLLPVRPNGSTGLVRAADVSVATNPYRIDIALGAHTLAVYEDDKLMAEHPIGVGTASTPTPGGKYYIKELLEPPDPGGPYGVVRLRPVGVLQRARRVQRRRRRDRHPRHQRPVEHRQRRQPRLHPPHQRGHHRDGRHPPARDPVHIAAWLAGAPAPVGARPP